MDIKTKMDYFKKQVVSVSRADDSDSAVRKAALDQMQSFIEEERAAIDARLEAKVSELKG